MKKLYKSIFFSIALLLGMTSCDNKDELPPTGPRDNAEKLVAGTYVGEWTCETEGTEEVVKGIGTVTFSVNEAYSNNVCEVKLTAEDFDLRIDEPKTSVCNVSMLSSGEFAYWNYTSSNPFGATFYGQVDTDGIATMYYVIKVKENRKEITYNYSFNGKKQ